MTHDVPRRAAPGALLALGVLAAVAAPAAAQPARLPAEAVGQLAEAVLDARLAPGQELSRVPVARRGLRFDHARTLAAFGADTSVAALPGALRARVQPGTRALLDDCEQGARTPCARLGWSAYATISPVAVSDAQAIVRLHVAWPDRSGEAFVEGVAPTGRTSRVGFSAEIHLARDPVGRWVFVRQGRTAVGE